MTATATSYFLSADEVAQNRSCTGILDRLPQGAAIPVFDTASFIGNPNYDLNGLLTALLSYPQVLICRNGADGKIRTVDPILFAYLTSRCRIDTTSPR